MFTRAANLAGDDAGLTVLLAAGVPRVAHGVRLECECGDLSQWFSPGAAFRWEGDELWVGARRGASVCVVTTGAQAWRCPLHTPRASAERLAHAAARICAGEDPIPTLALPFKGRARVGMGSARGSDTPHPGHVAVRSRLALLADAYRAGDAAAIAQAVHTLIGLGPGLTPAGDDALIGWLAGTALLPVEPRRDALCAAIRRCLPRTTDVSRAHLEDALAGEFSEPLAHFANALLVSTVRARDALAELAAVGATSGLDAANGLLVALVAMHETQVCDA